MTILLNRSYAGYASATVVELPASTEASLIAQGLASASSAQITPGNVTANVMRGTCAIATGASSVTVTNSNVDATSVVLAVISQPAADGTLTSITRVYPTGSVGPQSGQFVITGNANATAPVTIDWVVFNSFQTPLN